MGSSPQKKIDKEVIDMIEFCTCGSIINDGQCTNKNCSNKAHSSQVKGRSGKKTAEAKKAPKTTKSRRSSKVITYNLYEAEREEI